MATQLVVRRSAVAVGVALAIVAFLRGNYLLGSTYGLAYAAVTFGLVWLLANSRTRMRAGLVAAVALVTGLIMVWPASFNSGIQQAIDQHGVDRTARAELARVFASDPGYRHLSVSSTHRKVVNITVEGSLEKHTDLDRLRRRIAGECPVLRACVLHWEVALRDSRQYITGLDQDLFPTVGAPGG